MRTLGDRKPSSAGAHGVRGFAEMSDSPSAATGAAPPTTCIEAEPFALRVTDDSMEPEFAAGCIIIVDPHRCREGRGVRARRDRRRVHLPQTGSNRRRRPARRAQRRLRARRARRGACVGARRGGPARRPRGAGITSDTTDRPRDSRSPRSPSAGRSAVSTRTSRSTQAKTTQVVAMYFTPALENHAAVFVGPERWKEQQLAFLRRHLHRLVAELGLAARPLHVVEIPDCHELAVAELVAAPRRCASGRTRRGACAAGRIQRP